MIEFTVKLPHVPDPSYLNSAGKSLIVRSIVNTLYMQGFGVVTITFPDGDTNDCDAPVSDRQAPHA